VTAETSFLPVSREEMRERGWYYYDFLVVTGDAYVDHPSFGHAVISRVLESAGYRVAVLAQPQWKDASAFEAMGAPRYAVLVGAGNLDSMVAHYTAAKKRRHDDAYSPGRKAGLRPDRATIVYSNLARAAFPGVPVVIGALEASLRRFAHYDYWEDKVRRSMLCDSGADLLVYGMGERATLEIAAALAAGKKPADIRAVRGTAFMAADISECRFKYAECPSYEEVCADKKAYAEAAMLQYAEHDPVRGRAVVQRHGERYLIVNPPAMPLGTKELDEVSELPYTREAHPMYDKLGGVPAIEEVRFSVIHNRGCFGGCNFCSLAFHQGRMVTSRSHESVLREVREMTKHPLFKGYVHDVGGPTANFRGPSCKKQLKSGMCADRSCLAPEKCPALTADHSDYVELLKKLRAVPGVKKVFVRSGVRFDYVMADKSGEILSQLVQHHISGQLRVAPEHCMDGVLYYMGKPKNEVYERFSERFAKLNERFGMKQYLVPYLMSSHPGSRMQDALELALYLRKKNIHPEQVQDFYPTPGTLSTAMYYTGLDPRTMKSVYVARSPKEKAQQRALLQYFIPSMRETVAEALRSMHREDLIGFSRGCLIPPPGAAKKGAPAKKGAAAPAKPRPGAKQAKPAKTEKSRAAGKSAKPPAKKRNKK